MTDNTTGYGCMQFCAGRAMSWLGRACACAMLALLSAAWGCGPAADRAGKQVFVPELNGKTLNLTEMLYYDGRLFDPVTGRPVPLLEGEQDAFLFGPDRLEFREGLCMYPFELRDYPVAVGYVDATGRLVDRKPGWVLPEGRSFASKETPDGNSLIGIIDRGGRWVVPPKYEQFGDMSEGRCAVRVGNRWGFLDIVGNEVIPPKFGNLLGLPFEPVFHDGFAAVVDETEGLVYIDKAGKIAIRPPDLCTRIDDFSEGLARIDVMDTDKLTKEEIAKALAYQKETLKDVFLAGEGWGGGTHHTKTGYLSVSGRMAIPPIRRESYRFSGGLAVACNMGGGGGNAEWLWGYINVSGDWAIGPKFEDAKPFSEGLARVKHKGLWGYIDPSGEFVIEPQFERAKDFHNGIALVWTWEKQKKGFRIHYIDRAGKTVMVVEGDFVPIDMH